MENKKALVFGATGLVGKKLVSVLLNSEAYASVTIMVRSPIQLRHPKLNQLVVDFRKLDDAAEAFAVEDIYCCLGTTIKKAGSQEAFAKVDVHYPLEIARLAKQAGASRMSVISSLGANARSSIFYSRMKGKMEDGVRLSGPPSVDVFRPSLLLGHREEHRPGEKFWTVAWRILQPVMAGPLRKYRPIQDHTVAAAMHNAAQSGPSGFRVFESDRIESISRG